jgi:hypothetical protein
MSYTVTISYNSGSLVFQMTVGMVDYINSFTLNGVEKQDTGGVYIAGSIINLTVINNFTELEALLGITTPSGPYAVGSTGTSGTITTTDEGIGPFNIEVLIQDNACFNEGTKILCLNNKEEEYVPIENLRVGDIVKTYHYGYRKIELIGKNHLINHPDNKFTSSMYKMEKTESNGLIEDLIVTGGHSILVDDLGNQKELNEKLFGEQKIEDKFLLLAAASNDFVKINDTEKYTYYHFVLEDNGNDKMKFGVWANGVLSETISKQFFLISF